MQNEEVLRRRLGIPGRCDEAVGAAKRFFSDEFSTFGLVDLEHIVFIRSKSCAEKTCRALLFPKV